uniref:Conotoxin-like S3 n=1 Tax=Odontomachus monticola TaxID=613454 RepID=A0A348G5W5_ODOMO
MKLVVFALLVCFIIAMALAAPQGEKTCSEKFGHCYSTDNCCPGLICLSYAAKCVLKMGLAAPEDDASAYWLE